VRRALLLPLLLACSGGSSEPVEAAPPPPPPPPAVDAGPADAGPDHTPSAELTRCASRRAEVASIADVVARLNALAPVDAPCFVASLPRPLAVTATHDVTSAQPAASKASPRLFFLLPTIVISAVPEGEGGKLLELGEWVTPTRTIKGEIAVPVAAPLASDAPYKKVLQGQFATVCGVCHHGESAHPTIPDAFVSVAFKPRRAALVTVAELEAHHRACVRAADQSARCEMFHAIFDFGPVTQGAFADEVETFITR
jgi:hypothetical protein